MQLLVLILIFLFGASSSLESAETNFQKEKITFDLNSIDADGVRGGSYVDYEFCIPREESQLTQVKTIDPGIKCFQGSGGRIGCTENEYLCIGSTGLLKDYRKVLFELAQLEYVKRIDECFWE